MIRRVLKSSYGKAILFVAALVNCSYGDFIFISGTNSLTVGENFTLDVYLDSNDPSLSPLIQSNPPTGIVSGDFQVAISGSSALLTEVTGNRFAFDPVTDASSLPWIVLQSQLDPLKATKGVDVGNGFFRVLLGQISGVASTPGYTFFTIVDPYVESDNIVLDDGSEVPVLLDSQVFPSTAFKLTVTGSSSAAVPEPSSLALVAIGATVAGYRHARRRYSKKAAT